MEWKQILIWLLVFIVGSLIVSFLVYPSSFQSFKSNVKSIVPSISNSNLNSSTSKIEVLTDFEDITRNPENYVNKQISIKGKLTSYYPDSSLCAIYLNKNCDEFGDNSGYIIKVLPIGDRKFNMEQSYTFIGIFTKKDYPVLSGIKSFYYLAEE